MEPWIDSLVGRAPDLSQASKKQYAGALRYWALWYSLRYSEPLPLTRDPPRPVAGHVVADFFADHTPIFENGALRPAMEPALARELAAAGFNRHVDCPSPSTTRVRCAALTHALRVAGKRIDERGIAESFKQLQSQWAAEAAATGRGSSVPVSSALATQQLIAACDLSWDTGAEDAALVLLCQRLTLAQVMSLTYEEVKPGTIRPGFTDAGQICVGIDLVAPATEFQRFQRGVLFVGNDADVLSAWGSHLQYLEVGPDSHFIWGPRKATTSREDWARRRFAEIARRSGFYTGRGPTGLSPSRFRALYERERRSKTPVLQLARRAGLSESGALGLIERAYATQARR